MLHPFLLAAFPVLSLLSANVAEQLSPAVAVIPLALSVGGAGAAFLLAWALTRSALRGGLIASALVVLVFSYGHVWESLRGARVGALTLESETAFLLLWAGLGVATVARAARAGERAASLNAGLNVAAAALVALNLVPLATHYARVGGMPVAVASPDRLPAAGRRPDVYYLVFDRYANEQTLRERFAFDNAGFLGWLRERGFFVASHSTANYGKTAHSLASSLNMDYLDSLVESPEASSYGPLYGLLHGSRVAKALKAIGYRYVNVGSGWDPTQADPLADLDVRYETWSEFSSVLYETTVLAPLGRRLGVGGEQLDRRRAKAARIRFQFDKLVEARDLPGPTFVFAHFLLPHDPYVFDRNGRQLSEEEDLARRFGRKYLDQLLYANAQIRRVVEELLSGPEETRPIVILQSDEGPDPSRVREDPFGFDWRAATPGELRAKFRILNAYYLPGIESAGLYPSITPVNTFRLLFRAYFGADLPLLPDRSYQYEDARHPYTSVDVTKRVAGQR